MRKTDKISLELDRTMPWLKGKRRTPHKPEICLKEGGVELVRNAASSEKPLWLKPQSLDGQDMFFAQAKLRRGDSVSAPNEPRFGRGLQHLILLEDLLRNRLALIESGNRRKKIEGTEIFAFKHSAATHDVTIFRRPCSVKTAANCL